MGEPPLRGMYHAGKPLAHRTPKKNLFGSAATVRPQVFPNEATAFHPWLPQRSRRARLCAWAARKLPSGAAWRMQMAGVAWNSCTLWTFGLRPGRGCNPVDIAIVRTTQRKNVQPWPDLPEYVFLRRMRWTRPCPTCSDSAACHKKCIQDAMLCAGCDGGQHTVDQHTAAGCCAGRMPEASATRTLRKPRVKTSCFVWKELSKRLAQHTMFPAGPAFFTKRGNDFTKRGKG